jgi:cytochrome c oxidase assembly factor CtaG
MQKRAIDEQFGSRHILTLIAGLIASLIALLVPMDILGMYHMFTVHMVQHLLLSLAAPPLFILSVPPAYLRRFSDRHKGIARVASLLTTPFIASALFNGNLWIWHAPPMLQIMMSNTAVHVFANILYLATGLLFWWPLLNPMQDTRRALSLGGKLAYLFFSDMPMMLLGAGMTFSGPLYSFDMTNPTMHMVVTAADQQLGGLLMWIVGSIFFIVLASIFFLRWMIQQEKVQQAREIAQDSAEEEYEEEEEIQEGQEGRMVSNAHTPSQGHRV